MEHSWVTDSTNIDMSRVERIGLLLFLLMLFAFGLFDHSFWSSNDTREGAMVWDMYHGGRWVTPTLNGEPYLEKPPLLHWTGVILCYLTGTVNEGLLRMPAALYGFGAVFIACLFGWKLGRRRAGFAAAFMCGTSILYLEYSKIVLTDMSLTFMTMLSFYLFWQAYTAKKAVRFRFALFVATSAVTFYAKGLLGPGFVWVSVGFFLLWKRKWKLLTILSLSFAITFVIVLAPWVWALWKTGGCDFLRIVFWDNQFGRFLQFNGQDLPKDPYFVHKEPVYYYLRELPIVFLPWTLLVVPALFAWFRINPAKSCPHAFTLPADENLITQRTDLATFLRFGLVSMAVILHASSAKVGCYFLPLFPIIFLMTAVWMDDTTRAWNSRPVRWIFGITTGLLTVLAVLIPTAYLALYFLPQPLCDRYFDGSNILKAAGPISRTGLYVALLLILIEVYAVRLILVRWKQGHRALVALYMPVLFAVVVILGTTMFIPAMEFQRSYKPFAALVRSEMDAGRRIALASEEEKYIGAFTFYLDSRLPIVRTPEEVRNFLFTPGRPAGVIIIETNDLPRLLGDVNPATIRIVNTPYPGYKSAGFRLVLAKLPDSP